MLDIKFVRENKDLIKGAVKKRHLDFDVEELLKTDDRRREILASFEEKKALQNKFNEKISQATDQSERANMIEQMKILKNELSKEEEELKQVMQEWQKMMLKVPNIPDMSVPEGESEDDNKEAMAWGEKPEFNFQPKDHITLMKDLDMVDLDRGTKVHGFRGYFLKNDGVLLSWAIWNYARDFFLKKNFTPFIPPTIVNKEFLYGTGHLPSDAEDLFETQDGQYLSGTGEIPMMAYHSEETLSAEDLPKKYLAFSPCFRREAGSHGKDTKGLIRVHEFYKWEQVILCEASHDESVKLHEEINRNTEEFIESLKLPYRRLVISTGDLKAAQVKCYDTEIWVPAEEKYREIASASYYHDFQSRRFNIRYRDKDGKLRYAHSLNATAIPTPRILVSLVENFQQEDGSIKIPEALRPYMGGRESINKN